MQDRSVPLILAAAAFLAVLLWRVRPALSWKQQRASRAALRETLQSLRSDGRSVELVARAVAGLAGRPRRLEAVLWRHLAAVPWTGDSAEAARASLDALRALYEGPLRNAVRARALAHACDALGQPGGQNTVGSA